MKTSEFKQAVEELGFDLTIYDSSIDVYKKSTTLLTVSRKHLLDIDSHYPEFRRTEDNTKQELFNLVFEYAATPLDEREEERKWYIKCPITGQFLNKSINNQNHWWTINCGDEAMYTRAEIEAFTFEHAHLIEDEVTE